MKKVLLFLTAIDSRPKAQRLARLLLKRRVAACVTIVAGADSWYWWKGKEEHAREFLLLMKTSSRLKDRLVRTLKTHHSYDVPEILALPIAWGDPAYLTWLFQSVSKDSSS